MRGFTILLVVMWHVSYFGLGFDSSDTFNLQQYVFVPLRMPLFFFVSGFLMYKAAFQWNYSNTAQFLKKKVLVQVISPLIFKEAILFRLYMIHAKEGIGLRLHCLSIF